MSVHQLTSVLDRLDEENRTILEWAVSKRQAIMDNQVDVLVAVTNHETRALKRIELLEAERVDACQAILSERGVKTRLNLTISEITRLVFDPEEKIRLLDTQSKLNHTLQELKAANELNQKLIEQSLQFLDYSLDLLAGAPEDQTTYKHPMKSGGSSRSGLFDTRA